MLIQLNRLDEMAMVMDELNSTTAGPEDRGTRLTKNRQLLPYPPVCRFLTSVPPSYFSTSLHPMYKEILILSMCKH